ncbi:hypothetical protein PoB_003419200 [Plakobranchus ocellatus]|uniref:Uncharacterized protein n=1 Tax=Plakobranchus ocellatus TaxID=259542 RepID=A0AAV4AKA6_9GAST|nr:hypothetical protein PoB_003419200 [Plakobranchus ocellatus]
MIHMSFDPQEKKIILIDLDVSEATQYYYCLLNPRFLETPVSATITIFLWLFMFFGMQAGYCKMAPNFEALIRPGQGHRWHSGKQIRPEIRRDHSVAGSSSATDVL